MSPLQNYQAHESMRFMPAPVQALPAAHVLPMVRSDASRAWLAGPLETFSLCMASHGLCVSSAMMLDDKQYAVHQISCAQSLADDMLGELATALYRQLKLQQ